MHAAKAYDDEDKDGSNGDMSKLRLVQYAEWRVQNPEYNAKSSFVGINLIAVSPPEVSCISSAH